MRKSQQVKREQACELIDTLWNVNEDYLIADGLKVNGINRYIMECK